MKHQLHILFMLLAVLPACGSLEEKAALLSVGDTKEQVLATLGTPQDRQLRV